MKKAIISLLLCTSVLASCKDFLTEEHPSKFTIDYIVTSEDGLELGVTALYNRQRYYTNDTESATMFALVRATDEAMTNGGTGNYFGIYDPQYLKPSSAQVAFMWTTMYDIIGKANTLIEAGEKLPDTPNLRRIIAEAKCFRAQSYFLLYRTYDRIWLNTLATTPENVDDERDIRPATQTEVFDLLYKDLDYAIENLDWTTEEPGRFTQGAARHIKAKAALWIKDWPEALTQVEAIDQSGAFDLVEVDKVFTGAELNHKEAILTQQWSKNPGGNLSAATPSGNYIAALFIGIYRQEIGGAADEACSYQNWGYTYGRCLPSPYLFSLYDQSKDKRYTSWYIHRYMNTTNKDIPYGAVVVKPGEYFPERKDGVVNKNLLPGITKYGDIWARGTSETKSYKDVIVYRLAETYIIGAEAALMSGDQTLAKYYYNKTWQRAGNNQFTGTLTMKDVIDEQARELAFEGDRWYFLKRLGILIDQVKNYAGHPEVSASLAGRTNLPANPHFIRWPIPETEVTDLGADRFPQNPGYN